MPNERTILLVDMNSFFASIEQQCNPDIKGKPVLVGGGPGKRSVVAAASYESRKFGIHSGMPMLEALRLCPNAVIVVGDLAKYEDTARRVFRICMDYTDQLEIYSIDECFMDVSATAHLFGGAWEIGRMIKRRIYETLGLTCSVGIGPNKMIAKFASGMKKPDGLTRLGKEELPALLENLPVEKLHGIGDRLAIRLSRMGITTAGSLGRVPVDRLKKEFGILGEVLHNMGNGVDESPVVPYHTQPDVKSVGHSYTLKENTRDLDVIHRQLLRLSEMVGWRLREGSYAGRTVSLVLRYSDMHTFSRQKSISQYLDDGADIYDVACRILSQQEDDGRAIRLLGVCVSNLVKGMHQPDLFRNPRWGDALRAMDAINTKYGEFTVKRASLLDVHTAAKTHGFSKEISREAERQGTETWAG
ncbi:MAG: DNA polymerase IV [Armatimonadota bacterium]